MKAVAMNDNTTTPALSAEGVAKPQMYQLLLLCLLLVALTLGIYAQVASHQFINLDDTDYVTSNPNVAGGLRAENVEWAFTTVHAANWHPLTWLSHMTDVTLFGMNPRGHHLTNVACHAAAAVLLFLLFVRLSGAVWQSFFVAALFALHPLHVESVAWVAERKDVLSALFGFLTLYCYAAYVQQQSTLRYLLALAFFVLGLLTKPMLVTWPLVMLLLDYWPLGRIRQSSAVPLRQQIAVFAGLLKEKIPFLLCAAVSAGITIYAQDKGGAIAGLAVVPWRLRCENAMVACVTYLGNTLYPHDLAVYYPFPGTIPLWQAVSAAAVLLVITAAVLKTMQNHPYLAVGWSWFLITLVPVIGLVHIGAQARADRYTYLPLIGLFVMAAWGVPACARRWRHGKSLTALLAVVVVLVSLVISWQQLGYWRDGITLYRHTLAVTKDNYLIHNNLGAALMGSGRVDEAIQEYRASLQIKPDHASALLNLGGALHLKGQLDEAALHYKAALREEPDNIAVHTNLGSILAYKGLLDEAITEYRQVVTAPFASCDAHYQLGLLLSRKGNLKEAMDEFQQALRIEPDNQKVLFSMRLTAEQQKAAAQ